MFVNIHFVLPISSFSIFAFTRVTFVDFTIRDIRVKLPDKVMSQRILLIKTAEMFTSTRCFNPECKRAAALLKDEKIYTKKATCNEAVQFHDTGLLVT